MPRRVDALLGAGGRRNGRLAYMLLFSNAVLPIWPIRYLQMLQCEQELQPDPSARDTTLLSRTDLPALGLHLEPGTLIGETYRVQHLLGSGGMGIVILAHDEALDRYVAIKFVRDHLLDHGFRARFVTEARAMARVSHPNLVQIHTFGEHFGCPYFVMEFVEGATLDTWLAARSGPLGLDECVSLLGGICAAVSAIHAADAVHRDLKPSNILVQADLRPRVADLGLALFRSDQTCCEVVGTPAYMAPEVGLGFVVTPDLLPRADVYSLGCVAYELLTGRQPYRAQSGRELLLRHARDPLPSIREIRSDLPPDLDLALQRALAKNPIDRTASVETFYREVVDACRRDANPTRILVAEDSDDFRDTLDVTLKAAFCDAEVECVANGTAALAAFDRKRPSVIIIDFRMPGLDGLQLTRLFRARSASSTIPIIVLTASGGSREWVEFRAQGADRLLVKPVVLEDVVALVKRVVLERRTSPAS
jgi:eukaryotic-like serine/threonine-protein kinase